MLQPIEVLHEEQWVPATLMSIRRDADGLHGLVGYTDVTTRKGYYRWLHESQFRVVHAPDAAERRPRHGWSA